MTNPFDDENAAYVVLLNDDSRRACNLYVRQYRRAGRSNRLATQRAAALYVRPVRVSGSGGAQANELTDER
jgi:hypothetical protein